MLKLLLLISTLTLAACAHMSAAKRECLSSCARHNDRCVVHAMEATTLQACDGESKQCTASCDDL
jgi:hypothetical protein